MSYQYEEEQTEKQVPVQKWIQSKSFKFKGDTEAEGYTLAKAKFDTLVDAKRKRIRRRADGSFDVVIYTLREKPKAEVSEEQPQKRRRKGREAQAEENLGQDQ